jgi:hypothetical protein
MLKKCNRNLIKYDKHDSFKLLMLNSIIKIIENNLIIKSNEIFLII